MDLRDYKGVIRDAVRRERNCDERWYWKVRAISKDAAKIGWGYLDWLDDAQKENFVVTIDEDEDFGTAVIGVVPNGHKIIRFVGSKRWDDYESIEGGIAGVIHEMAQYAHSRY